MISEMTYDEDQPVPIGIFYKENKPTYESMLVSQINRAKEVQKMDLQSIIAGSNTWEVK